MAKKNAEQIDTPNDESLSATEATREGNDIPRKGRRWFSQAPNVQATTKPERVWFHGDLEGEWYEWVPASIVLYDRAISEALKDIRGNSGDEKVIRPMLASKMITSWSLEYEEGKPVPIEYGIIAQAGGAFLAGINPVLDAAFDFLLLRS
jgi:hypothetical protein